MVEWRARNRLEKKGGKRIASAIEMEDVSAAPIALRRARASVVRSAGGDAALLADLRSLRDLFGSHHLSDVLFVFASPTRASDVTTAEAAGATADESEEPPEHHLLPAHRLVLALRSGTFRAALRRSTSSHVPSRVRFPLKIHVRDTPFRVFAALVYFLYTSEVVDSGGGSSSSEGGSEGEQQVEVMGRSAAAAKQRERQEFWKELLRASFVYLVPSLLEICVEQIVGMLAGRSDRDTETLANNEQETVDTTAATTTQQQENGGTDEWDPEMLRRILDVLVFADSVLAAKHPAAVAAPKRRVSKKAADDLLPTSLRSPRAAAGVKENGFRDSTSDAQDGDDDDDDEALVLAGCLASITQLQELCMRKLKVVPEDKFEALVHTEVGRRCTTERLCAILKQRSDTPLVVAIRYQLGRVVNELLKRGEPLDKVSSDESDLPLVAALKTGNDSIVRRLLVDEHAPYFLLTDKIPVFYLACASGSVQHCQILIEQSNAQVNMISQLEEGGKEIVAEFGRGQTPLHIASRKGHSQVVELLLSHNAVANLQDDEGNTALHWAGNMEVAEILLSSSFKTNPNIPNRRGQTPLHVAAAKGNVGIVDMLIRSACQQDIVDDQGQTAFHVAAANGHTSVALILLRENEAFERTQLFRKHSEKLSLANGDSNSANDGKGDDAQSTTDDNDSDTAAQFVVNQEDLKGNTALHLAAMSPSDRCQKMIQVLLENGADPNHTNWFGYTPLHLFCSHQSGPDSVVDVFVRVVAGCLVLVQFSMNVSW